VGRAGLLRDPEGGGIQPKAPFSLRSKGWLL